MKPSEYYAICIGGIIAVRLLTSLARYVPKTWRLLMHKWFLKHVYYPTLPPIPGLDTMMTRFDLLVICLLVVGNVCAVTIRLDSVSHFIQRLGHIALINLIFLSVGGRMNIFVSLSNVRYERYAGMHKLVGIIMVIQAGLHAILSRNQIDLSRSADIAGLVASCAMGFMVVSSLPFLRSWVFELYSSLHTLLAITVMITLWLHLPLLPLKTPQIYLLVSSIIFAFIKLVRLGTTACFSISPNGASIATIHQNGAGVELRVFLRRRQKFHPGQFVYLCLPSFSTLSVLQSHPFQISWAYQDEKGRQVLVLLVKPRRGFTGQLTLAPSDRRYHAFVEGPYGRHLNLGQYGTVLLFATGIGIAGQLPYLKELLELYIDCRVKTRRISLFWEIDKEVYRYWVRSWMDRLLEMDTDYVLDVQVYITGHYLVKNAKEGDVEVLGQHKRITLRYIPMPAAELVETEIKRRRGETLISVCTKPQTTREITRQVCSMMDEEIHLKELEFRPWTPSILD